jgi:hypothetical protein
MLTRTCSALILVIVTLVCPAISRADVVLEWNSIMVTTLSSQNPFAQARFAAITQLAVFEAVNAVTGDYQPYLGTIPASPGASADAAAVAAAHRVLRTYFPGSADALDARRNASLASIPDGPAKDMGIALGIAAADAMIAERSADGSAPPAFHVPPSSDPGEWQRTPSCPAAGGILRHWGQVAPFGIESSSQFRSDPPPALDSAQYAHDYNEVRLVGGQDSAARPQDRADVARFYAIVLAVGTWNPAVRQVAAARGTSLSENARAFALLNMAISDGLVSVMETKYHYRTWRPETAIHAGDVDGNDKTHGDPAFAPFVTAPCFPGYASAHASASYAARRVAEHIFGEDGFTLVLSSAALPGVTLTYSAFSDITTDIDDARVYGGIHFRFDQHAGARQGKEIGKYISKHHLRPVHER